MVNTTPEGWPLEPFLISPTVLNSYGADRARIRAIMEQAFNEQRTVELRENLRTRVSGYLENLAIMNPVNLVDIRRDYASVVAMDTLCDLFGIPESDWAQAHSTIASLLDPPKDPDEATAASNSAISFLQSLLDSKKGSVGDDLASVVQRAAHVEERLPALIVTIAGGIQSPTELLTNTVYNMLTEPEQRVLVLNGTVGWSEAIDESLRKDGPVQHMPLRYAIADIDLGDGVVIRQGDAILLGFGACGRDSRRHPDRPEVFDVQRQDKAHFALGLGVHHCIGGAIGRIQAEIALPALFERFPDIQLAVDADALEPVPSYLFSGWASLPVRL
ncbi:cytochrome P450 (plasmid) [Streptomyces sp. AHU1]|uniref:cytochrome P450 n=1 Tax=Streptomyces sp. AHU1 TaxID=3377215 RepID=UPI0038783ADB